ncbi:hypothetical protein P7K49_000510 [Saguinus oedipus]|uniref:Uncharacterized protein n=1 Tax=Saguinus oedipus TaxID=9490 RepID=A0ABQ9WDL0_SAGOE|nr:hypothetical protein P7K49_000510 [Saguinus oedipus]
MPEKRAGAQAAGSSWVYLDNGREHFESDHRPGSWRQIPGSVSGSFRVLRASEGRSQR